MARRSSRRLAAVGQIRIVGGHWRRSVLTVPDREGLRPTPVRIRQTLFDWLAPVIAGARCVDLFAGTGALGMEALSRGAAAACFIERDAELAQALDHNLERLGCTTALVRTGTAQDALATPLPWPADVVFIDPPYAARLWEVTAASLITSGWLAPAARVFVELPRAVDVALPQSWQLQRETRAGDVRGLLYRV